MHAALAYGQIEAVEDFLAFDLDIVGTSIDILLKIAQDGVILQQVGQGLGIGQIVDRNKL